MHSGAFELQVCVAGAPLPELHAPNGEVYVEARFDTPATYMQRVTERDPYGQSFTQRWPVTPYTLRVVNRSADRVKACVYIDGARASRQYVDGGAVTDIMGWKDKSSKSAPFREFLFAAPRPVRAGEAEVLPLSAAQRAVLAQSLERICVKIYETEDAGVRHSVGGGGAVAAGIDAASKAVARGGGAAAVSAAGLTLGAPRAAKMRRAWRTGNKIATLCMRYTQREKLLRMGLIAQDAAAVARPRRAAREEKPEIIDLT